MEPVEAEGISYVMTVSRNGQVSIPASVRTRWQAEKVDIVDMGDCIVIGPHRDDAVTRLRGSLKGLLPNTDEIRRELKGQGETRS